MKTLTIFLLTACLALGQATNDLYYQKKAATGHSANYLPPSNGKVLFWNGNILGNYDIATALSGKAGLGTDNVFSGLSTFNEGATFNEVAGFNSDSIFNGPVSFSGATVSGIAPSAITGTAVTQAELTAKKGIRTFADETEMFASAPEYSGQPALSQDTGQWWYGGSLEVGSWNDSFSAGIVGAISMYANDLSVQNVAYLNGGAIISGVASFEGGNAHLTGLGSFGSDSINSLNLSPTWSTTGNPSLIYGRVSNALSGANSSLIDLGTNADGSLFRVSKSGAMTLSGHVGIRTASSGTIPLTVKGTGASSATRSFELRNSSDVVTFFVRDDGYSQYNELGVNTLYAFNGLTVSPFGVNDTHITRASAGVLRAGTTNSNALGSWQMASATLSSNLIVGQSSSLSFNARTQFTSGSDGTLQIKNNVGTSGVLFDVTTNGTLKIRNSSNTTGTGNLDVGGKISASIPAYANDAAADADATLLGGQLYKITGARTVYQKP